MADLYNGAGTSAPDTNWQEEEYVGGHFPAEN
jgi:hypothetical protein